MVPNGWNKQTVGDLCDFINGNGFKSSEWSDKGLPIIRIQNLNGSNNFNYYDGKVLEKWIVNQGDILFAWAGSKGVSFGAKYWNGPKGLLNQHIFRVEPKAHIDKKWLFWVLLKVTQRVENMAHGFKATLLHVQKADITEQVILVPSLSEQQKIAQILSTWDQAISATEKLLENSQQQKKALMQQLLTGKKRLLDENGVEFSDEWQRIELGLLLDYQQPTPYLVESTAYSNSYETPVLTAGKTFILGYTNESSGIYQDQLPVIIFDDFTTDSKYVNFPFKAKSSAMKILTAKKGVSIKFVFEAMQMLQFTVGGHQRHWISIFSNLVIPLPNIKEQQQIAEVLSLADQEIETLQKELDCLKQEKKALMQQLLTGKKRVKVAA